MIFIKVQKLFVHLFVEYLNSFQWINEIWKRHFLEVACRVRWMFISAESIMHTNVGSMYVKSIEYANVLIILHDKFLCLIQFYFSQLASSWKVVLLELVIGI